MCHHPFFPLFFPVSPALLGPPVPEEIGNDHVVIRWQDEYEGHGPIIGYVVNVRPSDTMSWSSVGFVAASSSWLSFNIAGLDPNTEYDVMVAMVHGDPGRKQAEGPVKLVRTLALGKDSKKIVA